MHIKREQVNVNGLQHPFLTIGTNNPGRVPIHFSGANGFPVACYASFLNRFTPERLVTGGDCRGAFTQRNLPPAKFGFQGFANDLIMLIEQQHSQPVIGMGHSFGAHITALAASQRPDLFDKLVLIEPASLPYPWMNTIYANCPSFILNTFYPMIPATQNRQRVWPSKKAFISKYQNHRTFHRFTDVAMNEYAEYGLSQRNDGQYELVFDPDWEAYIFRNVKFIWNVLKKVTVPCLFLRAEHSNLYSSKLFNAQNRRLNKNINGIEIKNTHHLMPFESPTLCANHIHSWLNNCN